MNSQTISYLGILLIGLAIGFFVGKGTTTSTKVLSEKEAVAKATSTSVKNVEPVSTTKVITEKDNAEADKAESEKDEASETETADASSSSGATELAAMDGCYSKEEEFSLQLTLFAEDIERQKLMYDRKNPEKLQDCSGIFHRVVQFVQSKCDYYTYPDPAQARDSRSLAKWYHSQGNLVIIDDPVKKANLIKPGSVLFFGSSGKKYPANLSIDQLAATNPKGIEHIGVVTEVSKDEAGNVTGYVMFHGRRQGVHAQRSHYHGLKPPRLGFPVLGNWEQEWLAIANIMTEK